MRQKGMKKLGTLLLVFAIAFAALAGDAPLVQAATTDYTTTVVGHETDTASAGVEVKIPFTLTENIGFVGYICVPSAVSAQVALYNSTGTLLTGWDGSHESNPLTVSPEYYTYVETSAIYGYMDTWIGSLPVGDYYYGVTFSEDTKYLIEIEQYSYNLTPKISQTTAIITKGFTKKLSVTNGTVKKWSSKDTKIAKVSSKGKITAVKKGNTTIYATLKDGTKLACKVTVKENQYSATKLTTGDVTSGKWYYQSYSAAYDSKGNLVLKVRVINNTEKNICELRNIAVTVKNSNGKTIGTYSLKTKSVSIESGSSKDFTFTIKKSALKINKTQDLRNAGITVTMKGYYYTYR